MSPLATDDYVDFCEGLRRICGVDLGQYKRPQMERRLRTFFTRKGITCLTDSLPLLRSSSDDLAELLDRVTINVSQLFRHPEQWHWLDQHLPELAKSGQLKVWSAGSSYGAEAFTIAAVCNQIVPRARVQILGTDIDPRMVARAREGRFRAEDARGVDLTRMEKGFTLLPEGGWQAKDTLKAMTRFEVGDLLRMKPPVGAYDLVFCRNTVIYFAEPVRDQLHARLATAVRSGGHLIVGATERVAHPGDLGLSMVHPFVYRKA